MSIGPYTISPFINNRQLNTACGLGNHDTQNTFLVSSYTSGDPSTVGLCVQGAGGADLDSGAPIDITQLWIDFLKSSVNFTIDAPQLTINNNVLMTGSITTENTGIFRRMTIEPGQIESLDTQNEPFGDPLFTRINPNLITMQNGNANNQTSSMSTTNINLTNTDTGFINDINADVITMQDTGSTQITRVSTTHINVNDVNLGLSTDTTAGAITATNWSIDTTGLGTFDTLTVNSIATVTAATLFGTTLSVGLDGHAICGSWTVTMNVNVTILNPTSGINGGVYKLWLTVGAIPRTFTKACGVINNLLGDTLMTAGSVWLIEIYKRSAGVYRANFTNFT
jgi:hypothetical protein